MENNNRLLIVDGMSLLFRSFYAMSRANLTTVDGTPIGAVYGFFKIIIKLLKEQKPTHVAIAWESGKKNFRHELYSEYKANRKAAPPDIIPQISLAQILCADFDIPNVSQVGYEGDDIIGTFAKRFGDDSEVLIVSSDKDFMQLVNQNIKILSLKTGDNYDILGREQVVDYFGVPPEQVIDVLALKGDSSDNVPGVAGIGPKKAEDLIKNFGSLENIYQRLEEIPDKKKKNALELNKDLAFLSKTLVTICCDIDLNLAESSYRFSYSRFATSDKGKLKLAQYKMTSLLQYLEEQKVPVTKIPSKEVKEVSIFDLPDSGESNSGYAEKIVTFSSWNQRNYALITTKQDLAAVCAQITSKTQRYFSFDTETTGLDIINDYPIGISLSFAEGTGCYIPVHELHLNACKAEVTKFEVIAALNLALASRTAVLIAHNLKFDMHMCVNINLNLGQAPWACSMVAAWVANPVETTYGLDPLTLRLLNLEKIPTSKLIGKETGRASMLDVPLNVITEYACEDADAVYRLWPLLEQAMQQAEVERIFWDIEMPTLQILQDMEHTGVSVDAKSLQAFAIEVKNTLVILETKIFEQASERFNVASPKQLGNILFEKLKVHEVIGYKGKLAKTTQGYKTDAQVLEQFVEHPTVALVLEYRELAKLLNTYIDVLPKLIKPATHRIHTDFHQTGTATGRLSSSGPNLQNIPIRSIYGKKIRAAFCVSKPENIITCADYSQIELRVLAHLAKDQTMISAFRKNIDIHRETSALIQKKNLDEVTSEERSAAKTINFGIIYGMGAQRLAKENGISVAEAKTFIEKYFENFSGIKTYIEQQREFAHKYGYVRTICGRIRPIKELNSNNGALARMAENIAVNSAIQGTAADLMKLGMIALYKKLKHEGLATKLLIQVHDEIMLEGPKQEEEIVARLVKESLENAMQLSVPLLAEVGQAANWIDAKN